MKHHLFACAAIVCFAVFTGTATPPLLAQTVRVTPYDVQEVPPEIAVVPSEHGPIRVTTLIQGLEQPWGMAFLPDGSLLVTERVGRLRRVWPDGHVSRPFAGLPEIAVGGEGGLLDVMIAPDYTVQPWIYLSYTERGKGGISTAVVRARMRDELLSDRQVIFRQQPKIGGQVHFGSRLVAAPGSKLFITLGDRYRRNAAQTLDNHYGKIVRLNRDGTVPPSNPFVDGDALPGIWSLGHRNIQGAAIHPVTGQLWAHEHGPRGGDELNVIKRGSNYGWPVITYGEEERGGQIGEGSGKPGLEQPVYYWSPSIAPSGMLFYTGAKFPAWRGDVLLGSLKFKRLLRLELENGEVAHEEAILQGELDWRIRDVEQGPDGAVYVLTGESEGRLLRLEPATTSNND